MKQIIIIALTLFSVNAYSQTLYIPSKPDSLKLPIQVNGVVRSIYVRDLFRNSGNTDSLAFRTTTLLNDTTFLLNRSNGTSDTIKVLGSGGGLTSASIVWPGAIYSTPTTGSIVGSALTFSPALASQSPYTIFGRGSGAGTPSFLSSLDSNWIPSLHTQAYYDARYTSISGGGATVVPDVLFSCAFTKPEDYVTNNLWYIENYGGTFVGGSDASRLACAALNTGTTTSGGTHIQTRMGGTYNLVPYSVKAEKFTIQWDAKLSALSTPTDRYVVNFGVSDVAGHVLEIQYSDRIISNSDGVHWSQMATNTTTNTINTTVTPDLNWHTFKIVFDGPNANVKSYIDNVLVATNTTMTSVPNAGLLELNINKETGTTNVTVNVTNIKIYR